MPRGLSSRTLGSHLPAQGLAQGAGAYLLSLRVSLQISSGRRQGSLAALLLQGANHFGAESQHLLLEGGEYIWLRAKIFAPGRIDSVLGP